MRLFKKNYETYNDEDLMLLFQKGDRKAFEQIYSRYSNHLVNFFFQKLWQDREKAEDRAQDIFSKIIQNPDLFDATKKFKTWVFTIAYNMCKNEYKRHEVRKNTKYEISEGIEAQDENDLGDTQVDKMNFKMRLKIELDKLKTKHSEVFTLRHDQGLSLKEIAEILNINEGTVKSRLHYTTKYLAEQLAEFKTIISE